MWKHFAERAGHRWQYRACALHAGYLRLKTHEVLTNPMEQSPSWEANSFLVIQEIPRILWQPKFNYGKSQFWAKNTHSEYVLLIAFPLHQLLHERSSIVHSCQQRSIGLKFSKSQTGSDVRYSCHHNSSRFTFYIFAHSCRFSVLHSLQSITPRIY